MTTEIDDLYPHLSTLAKSHGKTLNKFGKGAHHSHNNYLGLGDCCWFILNKRPRWRPGDHYNYLATLDEYVKIFSQTESKELWRKLVKRGHSTFLDTVVEAAWAIYFKDKGYMLQIEVPLPGSKNNADFMVAIDGKKWWLDAFSIGANQPCPSGQRTGMSSVGRRGIDAVISELVTKARKKYHEKFKDAVRSGLLDGSSRVGVLMCILKRAPSTIPPFIPHLVGGNEVQTPAGLFNNEHPGLDLVWVHSLIPLEGSEILKPTTVWKWVRNDPTET